MDYSIDEQDQSMANALCVKDRDGRIALMVGLLVNVFIEKPWTREVREAIADVAEDYIQQLREHLRWAMHPRTTRMHLIDSGRVQFPRDWLPQHDDGEDWELAFHGGETATSASPFQLIAYGAGEVGGSAGFLQVSLPLLWFSDHAGTLQEFALRLCTRLKPLSGYGGLGILESPDLRAQRSFQPIVHAIAKRFPGLEVESTSLCGPVRKGIKGVNWLTILSDRWVHEMGGLGSLRNSLDESFIFYPYEGGLIIQAGPKPQAGDVEANRWPQHYVTLSRVLKKIQVKEHYGFHCSPSPGSMQYEESKAWLFRFDDK